MSPTSVTTAQPSPVKRIWDSPYTFWAILSLPALPMIYDMAVLGRFRGVLHESGEFSARFLIISLMLTPLMMLLPKSRAIRWLMKRRRHIGVAAFGFAAVHTLAYLVSKAPFPPWWWTSSRPESGRAGWPS